MGKLKSGLSDMKKRAMLRWATAIWLLVFVNGYRPEAGAGDSQRADKALSNITRAILESGEKFILLSIDPTRTPPERSTANRKYFQNHKVLGQTEIKDPKRRSELLKALYAGAEKYEKGAFDPPQCFVPRHGIKAITGTNWVELVICFECQQIVEESNKGHAWTMVSEEPGQLFNRTLQEAGVPLAKR